MSQKIYSIALLYFLFIGSFPLSYDISIQLVDKTSTTLENLHSSDGKLTEILDSCHFYYRKNPEKYRDWAFLGLSESRKVKNDSFSLVFLAELAQGQIRTHQVDVALSTIKEALRLAISQNDLPALSKLYQNEGFAHYSQNNFIRATESLLTALNYTNDPGERARIQNNLGNIFQKMDDPEKALEYFELAYDFHRTQNDEMMIGSSLGNIGVALFDLHRYDESLKSLHQSLRIARSLADSIAISIRLENIANVYKNIPFADSAWYYYNGALEVATQLKDTAGLASIYKNMAEFISLNLERPIYALPYMTNAYRLATVLNDIHMIQLVQRALSDIYWSTGDYKMSRQYLEEYLVLKDSLAKMNREDIIRDLEVKYQSAEKERQLKTQELTLYKRTSQRNIFVTLSAIGVFLIFAVTYFLSKQIKLTRQVHEQRAILSEQELIKLKQEQENVALKSMLEGEDAERKRMAKELHDGLGGLLSTIKLSFSQSRRDKSGAIDNSFALIDKAHGELRRIAHNLMPGTLLKYGLVAAIEEICDEINYTGQISTTFQNYNVTEPLPEHYAFQIYRIVQELLQNIIKHAEAKEILVQLIERNNQLILMVEDDGVGLPGDFRDRPGLGMSNLKSRGDLLNAKINFESKKGEGTTFTVIIPKI